MLSTTAREAAASPPADQAIALLRGALDAAAAPAVRERLIGTLHAGPAG